MNCYTCERGPHAGGLHFDTQIAVGICHGCGVAICPEHGTKLGGQPFLCWECLDARQAHGKVLAASFAASAGQVESGR